MKENNEEKKVNTFGLFFRPVQKNTSNPGSRFDPYIQAHLEPDEKGQKRVVSDGLVNTYELIQKSKPDSILEMLVKFTNTGDVSVFNKKGNLGYLDNTQLPQDKEGWQDLPNQVKEVYDGLPEDIRAKFADYNTFVNSIVDGTYSDYFKNETEQKVVDEVKEEVK